MKFAKIFVLFLTLVGFTITPVHAQRGQETAFERDLNTRDDHPLREFVESKENIDVKQKASNLEISGDVRFEWRSIHEKGVTLIEDDSSYSSSEGSEHFRQKYRGLRGGHYVGSSGVPISYNDFDVEFNLKFQYTFKDAWAMAHLQFDNTAGIRGRNDCFGNYPVFDSSGHSIAFFLPRDSRFALKGSGEGNMVNLKRAYIGYNILTNDKQRLDIEVGRRKLNDIFDSEVQFTSRFDGMLLKYASTIPDIADWYLNGGPFVIDENVNHFGYAFEIGLVNIYDSGLTLRYNFIDWTKWGHNRCFIRNPLGARFRNSEVTFSYIIHPVIFCKETSCEFYGGFLINQAAKKTVFSRGKKENLAWYAGIYLGKVRKAKDWSMDLEYIVVKAQAVPEADVGSIGRDNILNEAFFDIVDETLSDYYSNYESEDLYSFPSSHLVGYFPRRGNTNFTGWRFEGLYALTDNLTLDITYECSRQYDKHIGGRHRYSSFEIETIYAF